MNALGGKMSRSSLKTYLASEDQAEVEKALVDGRATELESIGAEDPAALEAIREIFAGTGLPENQEKVRRILRVRSEIQKEWGDARDSFLAIGRALLALEN